MFINNVLDITMNKDGKFVVVLNGSRFTETDPEKIADLELIYMTCRKLASADRPNMLDELQKSGKLPAMFPLGDTSIDPTVALQEGLGQLMDFFTEFDFEPNFRFVNTLSRCLNGSTKNATDYIHSYFELTDSPYAPEVVEKTKSAEFKTLLKKVGAVAPTKTVNNRFKIYYGSAGTGKTTQAQKETSGRCIVCNNSMLPSDLMEDFVFVDGKATFKPSMLWRCMEDGTPITMDEINLLPFESLRFLQGILDGKTEFQYKGNTVHINEGFMVIGTMNLAVNGMVYGLPEPLVDRCAEMRKFKLTAEQLMSAIM